MDFWWTTFQSRRIYWPDSQPNGETHVILEIFSLAAPERHFKGKAPRQKKGIHVSKSCEDWRSSTTQRQRPWMKKPNQWQPKLSDCHNQSSTPQRTVNRKGTWHSLPKLWRKSIKHDLGPQFLGIPRTFTKDGDSTMQEASIIAEGAAISSHPQEETLFWKPQQQPRGGTTEDKTQWWS